MTDGNGNVVRRYDFLPMGGELWAGTGGRTSAMGYQTGPDGFNPKFTGQMRDTESGLDYFHARYYSQQQGRFLSPDPENAGADPMSPQTWNGYGYVGGSPLALTDPSGEGFSDFMNGLIGTIMNAIGNAAMGGLWGRLTGTGSGGPPISGLGGLNVGGLISDANSGPWNEQLPIGPGGIGWTGGGAAGGGVYGGGTSGGLIFSFAEDCRTQLKGCPFVPQVDPPVDPPIPDHVYDALPAVTINVGMFGVRQVNTGQWWQTMKLAEHARMKAAADRAYKTCRGNYLDKTYGSFLGRTVIPFFSLGTLWDAPGTYLKSSAEAGVVKGGPALLDEKYGSATARAALHRVGAAVAKIGVVVSVGATAADAD